MEQVLQYFKQADRLLDANEFADEEEYNLFIQNVFAEVEGLEYRLACSHDGSMLLEKILKVASPFQLRVFLEKVRGRLIDMCCHRYASHVVETWLKLAAAANSSETDEEERDQAGGPASIRELLDEVSHIAIESFVSLASDEYASHVLRLLICQWIGQTPVEGERQPSSVNKTGMPLPFNSDHLREFTRRLLVLPQEVFDLPQAAMCKHTSPVLQTFLQALLAGEAREELAKVYAILLPPKEANQTSQTTKSNVKQPRSRLLTICDHPVGSRFMEVLISTFDPADYLRFLNEFVRPHFMELLGGAHANFVLQACISHCKRLPSMEMLLTMVKPIARELIQPRRRHGLLVRLCQWVVEHELAAAEPVMAIIRDAFYVKDSHDGKLLFSLILSLQVKQQGAGESEVKEAGDQQAPHLSIQVGGTQILQHLMRFPATCAKPVIDGYLEMPVNALLALARHPSGSRVLEALLSSRTVSGIVKQRTGRKLRDHIVELALDRYGSHGVDYLWRVATSELRIALVEKLVASKSRLEDSQYGRIVLRNCGVAEYMGNEQGWQAGQEMLERRRAIFADLWDDDAIPTASTSSMGDRTEEADAPTKERLPDLLPASIQVRVKAGKDKDKDKDKGKSKNKNKNKSKGQREEKSEIKVHNGGKNKRSNPHAEDRPGSKAAKKQRKTK